VKISNLDSGCCFKHICFDDTELCACVVVTFCHIVLMYPISAFHMKTIQFPADAFLHNMNSRVHVFLKYVVTILYISLALA